MVTCTRTASEVAAKASSLDSETVRPGTLSNASVSTLLTRPNVGIARTTHASNARRESHFMSEPSRKRTKSIRDHRSAKAQGQGANALLGAGETSRTSKANEKRAARDSHGSP